MRAIHKSRSVRGGDSIPYRYAEQSEVKKLEKDWDTIERNVMAYLSPGYRGRHPVRDIRTIGSMSRGLVTCKVGGNVGPDMDVDLIVDGSYVTDPSRLWSMMKNALRDSAEPLGYRVCESTSVFTIKKVSDGRVVRSFDVAIVMYDSDRRLRVLRNHKDTGGYGFVDRGSTHQYMQRKRDWLDHRILNLDGLIADRYLDLKNKNERSDQKKSSFSIYLEVLNNLCNEYAQMNGGESFEIRSSPQDIVFLGICKATDPSRR